MENNQKQVYLSCINVPASLYKRTGTGHKLLYYGTLQHAKQSENHIGRESVSISDAQKWLFAGRGSHICSLMCVRSVLSVTWRSAGAPSTDCETNQLVPVFRFIKETIRVRRTEFCAALTTASAIFALISLIRSRRGYTRPASRSSFSSELASATDACSTIESVTRHALASNAPSPIPGKMYMLFPWPGSKVLSPREIGLYGEPEAKMTFPSVLYAHGQC